MNRSKEIRVRLKLKRLQEDPLFETLPGETLDPETIREKVLSHYIPESGSLHALIDGEDLILRWSLQPIHESAESLHREAMRFVKSKQLERAIETWQHATALNPGDPEYVYKMGLALYELRHFQEAAEAFQRTIRLCPIHAKAHLALGTLFFRFRKYPESEEHLLEALRLDPNNHLALLHLATLYGILKKFNDAVALFQELIRLSPTEIRAHFGLAKIYHTLGDFRLANRHFHRVIELGPETKMAEFARRAITREPHPSALALEEETEPDVLLEQEITEGIQAFIRGRLKDAITHYQKYLHVNPSDHYIWYLLGETLLRNGELSEASDCFKQAIRLNPKRGLYYKSYGLVSHFLGNTLEAYEMLKKALELGKTDPLTRTLFGIQLITKKKPQEAAKEFSFALKRDPNNPMAMYHMALVKLQLNEHEEAEEWFKKLINHPLDHQFKEQAKQALKKLAKGDMKFS